MRGHTLQALKTRGPPPPALVLGTPVYHEKIDPITQHAFLRCSFRRATSAALSPPSSRFKAGRQLSRRTPRLELGITCNWSAQSLLASLPPPSRSIDHQFLVDCSYLNFIYESLKIVPPCRLFWFKTNSTSVYAPLGSTDDLALAVGMMSRLHLSHQLRPTCLASLELVSASVQHPLALSQAS